MSVETQTFICCQFNIYFFSFPLHCEQNWPTNRICFFTCPEALQLHKAMSLLSLYTCIWCCLIKTIENKKNRTLWNINIVWLSSLWQVDVRKEKCTVLSFHLSYLSFFMHWFTKIGSNILVGVKRPYHCEDFQMKYSVYVAQYAVSLALVLISEW